MPLTPAPPPRRLPPSQLAGTSGPRAPLALVALKSSNPSSPSLRLAGVGRLGLVDHDVVDTSNLHRQIIHNELRLGMHKATSAAMSCAALNSGVQLEPHLQGLSAANAVQLVRQYDLVVDASDNPPTRYLISDACAATGRPLVSAAAVRCGPSAGRLRSRWRPWVLGASAGADGHAAVCPQVGTDGQLTVYCHGEDGPCYRCAAALPAGVHPWQEPLRGAQASL